MTAIHQADPNGSAMKAHLGFNVTGSSPERITLADIVGGDLDVAFTLEGDVHLGLHIRTGIGEDVPTSRRSSGRSTSTGTSPSVSRSPRPTSASTTSTSTSARS